MLNIGYGITCMVAELRRTVACAFSKLAAGVVDFERSPVRKCFGCCVNWMALEC